jgi:mono/diheme cytochrome c family protein
MAALGVGVGIWAGVHARADDASAGQKTFQASGCPTCHSVPAAGIDAMVKTGPMKGPDREFLRQRVQAEDGKKHAKAFTGSDDELAALTGWLRSLAAPRS